MDPPLYETFQSEKKLRQAYYVFQVGVIVSTGTVVRNDLCTQRALSNTRGKGRILNIDESMTYRYDQEQKSGLTKVYLLILFQES